MKNRKRTSAAKSLTERQQKNEPFTDQLAIATILDQYSTYPSKGLTPEKLATLLREADGGDIYRQMELFEEMLEKDGHLQALFQARRLAVTGKNYSIIPASDKPKDVELAAEVDKMVKKIRGWKNALGDILDSVPKGFSVNEILWAFRDGKYVVDGLRWRHQKRFRFGKIGDMNADPEELRFVVEVTQVDRLRGVVPETEIARATTDGISLSADPRIRRSFVIAYCKARSGHPARASLSRTCTHLFLFKNYDVKWWVRFAEILLGYRIGKYDPNQPDQKAILEKAIRGLGTDAAALISKDSEIEFASMTERFSVGSIYKDFKDHCNEEMTKTVLGHTGTTTGTPGKLGGEDMAEDVKQELVESDAQVIDEVVTDDIIRPYIDFNYGPQEEYPYYHTEIEREEDLEKTSKVVKGYQEMGGKVSKKWAKEKFGIPEPDPKDPEDEALEPMPSASPFLQAKAETIVADGKKKLLTKP